MDPLATLGLGPSATPEEVAAAYRRLAKRWHPDRAGSAERMSEINAAYDQLRSGTAATTNHVTAPTPPAPAPRRVKVAGHWLPESTRRALGRELLQALQDEEDVVLVTHVATWKSPRALLAVTDRRLLWLLDDAITHRVHSLKWRDVVAVEQRARRPLRRTAILRVETKLGRKLEWAELAPDTAATVAHLIARGAEL